MSDVENLAFVHSARPDDVLTPPRLRRDVARVAPVERVSAATNGMGPRSPIAAPDNASLVQHSTPRMRRFTEIWIAEARRLAGYAEAPACSR